MKVVTLNKSEPVRVAVYTRVSTSEQALHGHSLNCQPELIERTLVERYGPSGYIIVLSGQDPGFGGSVGPSVEMFKAPRTKRKWRDGLARVMEAIAAKEIDVVAFYDSSRLYRVLSWTLNFYDFALAHGVTPVSVMEKLDFSSPTGVFATQLLGAAAEFQRAQGNERIKAFIDLRREQGLWQGTAPYGWRFPTDTERQAGQPRTLMPIPEQVAVVKRIADLFLQGIGEAKIARQLNAEGIRHILKKKDPKSGEQDSRDWDWQSIDHILKCCAQAGLVKRADGTTSPGVHFEHRAYDPDVYEQIQQTRTARRKNLRGVPKERDDNLLSNLVRCGVCGQGLQFVKGQSDESHAYVCRGYRGRGDYHIYVPAASLLLAVLHEMEQFASLPELQRAGEGQIRTIIAAEMKDGPDRIRELAQLKDKLERQMAEALSHLRNHLLDDDLFAQQKEAIRTELIPIQSELSTLAQSRDGARFYEARLRRSLAALGSFRESWLGLEPDEQRELLRLAIENAEVRDLDTHTELHLKLGPFAEKVVPIPKQKASRGKAATGIQGLTQRELAALAYVLKKVRPRDAADQMRVSASTYSTLCKRAMERIGASTVPEAAKRASAWIDLVAHFLPMGPWKPKRRASAKETTLPEVIVAELYGDGHTIEEISISMGLSDSEITDMLNNAKSKDVKYGS